MKFSFFYLRADLRAVPHGGEPLLLRRDELEVRHLVSDRHQGGVELAQPGAEVQLQAGAVHHVAVKAGVVVVDLLREK